MFAGPFEKKGPEVLERTNRYNENDGVSKRVHELAFGFVNCFGSEGPGNRRSSRHRTLLAVIPRLHWNAALP